MGHFVAHTQVSQYDLGQAGLELFLREIPSHKLQILICKDFFLLFRSLMIDNYEK